MVASNLHDPSLRLIFKFVLFPLTTKRKYEEIYPPDVNEFVYITDTTYTKKQVLRMEQLILKVLTFDLFVPTLFTFINIYVTMNEVEDRVKYLATVSCFFFCFLFRL